MSSQLTVSPEFITETESTVDGAGILRTETPINKKKRRATKARRTAHKTKYVFNRASKIAQAYLDYFNPDHEAVCRLLGISKFVPLSPYACFPLLNRCTF
jgi:hypothetical protein